MKTGQSKRKKGFSLLEVMIALTVFAVFIISYVATEGQHKIDSTNMREELRLQQLAQEVISMLHLDPPDFQKQMTLTADTGKFEKEGFESYEYSIEYFEFTPIDLNALQNEDEGDEEATNLIPPQINKQFQKFQEEKLWQAVVTVTNKVTGFNYSLSTFLVNQKATLSLSL